MREPIEIRTIPIDAINIGDRHRKDMGDLTDLIKSLDKLGMLQPIGLTPEPEFSLVFGERRIRAAQVLGWEDVPYVVVDTIAGAAEALRAERDENACRKEMTPSELVSLGKAIEEIERPKATERKKSGAKAEPSGTGSGRSTGETRDAVGEAIGVSGRHYEQAKKVVEQGTPELVKAMDAGELSVKVAAKVAELPAAKQVKVAQAPDPKAEATKQIEKAERKPKAKPCDDKPADPLAEFVTRVNQLCATIDAASATVSDLASDPHGFHIHAESVRTQLHSARSTLWQSRPTEPCNCAKSGTAKPECKACRGCGITIKSRAQKGR